MNLIYSIIFAITGLYLLSNSVTSKQGLPDKLIGHVIWGIQIFLGLSLIFLPIILSLNQYQ